MVCSFFIMKYVILLIFIFSSCSKINWFRKNKEAPAPINLVNYKEFSSEDYIDHLVSYEKIYSNHQKRNIHNLRPGVKRYLEGIVKNISQKNELFFSQEISPDFYIIKSNVPFHFSLPGRKFFLSSGLIKKYIKNESLLYCVLAYELIRSEKKIYNKTIIIPTGVLSTPKVLSLLRISTYEKVEIHKWAYYLLKRIGLETDTYLTWLQVKNRNSLDFSLQLGDIQSISIEESMFKSFLIKSVKEKSRNYVYKGSSKKFYAFVRSIKG